MGSSIHVKAVKVWLIIIVFSLIGHAVTAVAGAVFGTQEAVNGKLIMALMGDCLEKGQALRTEDPEAALAASLRRQERLSAVNEQGARAFIGTVLSIVLNLALTYALCIVLIKYLSGAVVVVGDREITIKE